jgi:hypothetical protein
MKSLKLTGLLLLAAFTLAAVDAASAAAEAGFLLGGTGTPKTATILGGEFRLESSSKAKYGCEALDQSTLTFTNDKTATTVLHLLGCSFDKFAFNSKGDKSGEVLLSLKFLVCLDPKNSAGTLLNEFGIAAEIEGTLTLEVPGIGEDIELKGTLLGAILTAGSAKLFVVAFTNSGTAGEQTVKRCLEGATTLEDNLLSSFNRGAFELVSEEVPSGLLQFAQAAALMDS